MNCPTRAMSSLVAAFRLTLMRPDELRPVHLEMPIDVITRAAGHVPRKSSAQPGTPGAWAARPGR